MPPMNNRLLRPKPGPSARTLWFEPTDGDASWGRLGNWYVDAARTVPATRLPASIDTIVSDGPWVPVLGQRRVVAAAVVDDAGDGQELAGEIVVAAGATFAGAVIVAGLVVGHATIAESARLTGTVLGLATFTGSGCLDGGTATETVPDPPPAC